MSEEPAPSAIRAFVAVELDHEVRNAVARVQYLLKATGANVTYTPPEHMHVTLAFLGDIFPDQVQALGADLDALAGQSSPFRYQVAGLGFFGPIKTPRLVWAGIPTCPPLEALQAKVATAVQAHGITLEDRAFAPHITLGRIKSGRGVRDLTSLVASLRNSQFGGVSVERVLLMRSRVDEPQARYTIVHAAPLKGT